MADLTITATSVVAGAGARIEHGTAGVAVTAGQTGYLESSSNTYKLADANSATVEAREPDGIFLHAAAVGQPVALLTKGPITIGAPVTQGIGYYQSPTPGGICPVADLASGAEPSLIGFATSTTVIDVDFESAGVTL